MRKKQPFRLGTSEKPDLAVINPRTLKLVKIFQTGDCLPDGSELGPDNQLLLGCSGTGNNTIVLNIHTGLILKSFDQVTGSDEVWFNLETTTY